MKAVRDVFDTTEILPKLIPAAVPEYWYPVANDEEEPVEEPTDEPVVEPTV